MPSRLSPEVISMLEHIPNAFYAVDRNFCFLHANNLIQKLIGKNEDELIGRNVWEVFPSWKDRDLYGILTEAMSTGQAARMEEYSAVHQQWFEINAYPSSFGLAIYVTDVTERKKAESRLVMLNRAGEILASEHDLAASLEKIGRIIVPAFTDWFVVHERKGEIAEILHLHHEDPQKVRWAMEYRERMKFTMERPRPGTVPWVIRIGKPFLSNGGMNAELDNLATNDEHREMLKQVDFKARIVAPMPMRGKVIGSLSFTSSVSGKTYDEADLRFANDLGFLIGLSIENTRMFEEMKRELAHRIREHNDLGAKLTPETPAAV